MIYRFCTRCMTVHGRRQTCPAAAQQDNARRHRKQQAHGRDTAHWRQLCVQAKKLAGYQCENCGRLSGLTVHLDPALNGDHRAATIDTVTVLCRSCHGTVDAPRAHH